MNQIVGPESATGRAVAIQADVGVESDLVREYDEVRPLPRHPRSRVVDCADTVPREHKESGVI